MNLTITEIALIIIQVLLIPFAKYILAQQRSQILSEVLGVMNEHYAGLDSLIDRNKENIDKISASLIHKAEIVRLKNKILTARILDLENYLSKTGEFQTKCSFQLDDDDSGIL